MSGHFSVLVKSVPFFYTFISPLEYLIGQMYFFFQILPPLKCSVLSYVLSRHKFATNTSILLYIYQQIKFLVSLVCHRQSENYLCLHPPTHTKINKLASDTESPTCLKKKENKKLSEPAVVFANSILSLFQQTYFRVWLCVLCHCMCATAWVWSEVSSPYTTRVRRIKFRSFTPWQQVLLATESSH